MLLAALVIVTLKEASGKIDASQDAVLRQLAPSEYELIARWHNIPGFAAEIDPAAIERLKSDPLVLRIDPDVGGSGSLAQSVPLIGGDKVHTLGFTGAGVTVAILDTGVDESHPDLVGRIVDEQCFCRNSNGTGCCPNGQTTQSGTGAAADDHGHGSNVAGIVGSRGVVHPEVRAINMSLGTDALFSTACDTTASFTIAFANAINTLRDRGALTFVSSGNDASSVGMEAPACIANAISVGAVYDSNLGSVIAFSCTDTTTSADQITCFTNSNSTLDLLAPGAIITSDWLGGGLSNFFGTSQAAPHATGSAAVLMEVRPSLTPDEIEALLKSKGKSILDPRNGVVTPRIDLWLAVSALVSPPQRQRAAHH